MTPFDARPSPRLLFGPGRLAELADCVRSLGAAKPLLVTDPGIVAAGHVGRAVDLLEEAGIDVTVFEGSHVNPSESDIESCRAFAQSLQPDLIIGLGGGSSMDTAKGCNFLLNNGGRMSDFRGYGHAEHSMLPFIAIPTTAGTGSECQSYAVVSRDETHEKMACGDPKALAKIAILDPELTESQPPAVATLTALDALSHALESMVCTKRNPISIAYSHQSFDLVASAIEPVLRQEADLETRGRMLLGAAMAGLAIENSMLGAAHATANPLTARFGVPHGHAVSVMLPPVVRFNHADPGSASIYGKLSRHLDQSLPDWLDHILATAGLKPLDIPADAIPRLAEDATGQWTGNFNPRPLTASDFAALYQSALEIPVA
ncbi:iron alcohol dehydrogenase [Haloferula helveola]|uniref:Iron alcohol dehydrogenase n=1 Tax=Haloferula helveola TaxID=490095 RepID=A0ABM7RC33_9BACT|nr:iron alcohol dehydrogenase [Haloferula helveola]